tara:strand:- start:315 stop:1034 length:720 start_codon:yes stop_codon:yes gene_type:complete
MKPPAQGVAGAGGIKSTTVVHKQAQVANDDAQVSAETGFFLPSNDRHFGEHLKKAGGYQIATCQRLIKLSDTHETVLDIGAHVGLFSQPLSEVFQTVVAFEPVPTNFECLQKNVKNKNAILINAGIGKWGARKMYLHKGDNSGSWTHTEMEDVETGLAPIIPLDLFSFTGVISAIKMDIQGMETEALQSGEKLLLAHKPLICVEAKSKYGEDKTIQAYLESIGAVVVDQVNKDLFLKWV